MHIIGNLENRAKLRMVSHSFTAQGGGDLTEQSFSFFFTF